MADLSKPLRAMNNTGTKAITAVIVILIIVAIASIGVGTWLQFETLGDEGFGGIIAGIASLVLSALLKGFRTIVEAAALYISRNS